MTVCNVPVMSAGVLHAGRLTDVCRRKLETVTCVGVDSRGWTEGGKLKKRFSLIKCGGAKIAVAVR